MSKIIHRYYFIRAMFVLQMTSSLNAENIFYKKLPAYYNAGWKNSIRNYKILSVMSYFFAPTLFRQLNNKAERAKTKLEQRIVNSVNKKIADTLDAAIVDLQSDRAKKEKIAAYDKNYTMQLNSEDAQKKIYLNAQQEERYAKKEKIKTYTDYYNNTNENMSVNNVLTPLANIPEDATPEKVEPNRNADLVNPLFLKKYGNYGNKNSQEQQKEFLKKNWNKKIEAEADRLSTSIYTKGSAQQKDLEAAYIRDKKLKYQSPVD